MNRLFLAAIFFLSACPLVFAEDAEMSYRERMLKDVSYLPAEYAAPILQSVEDSAKKLPKEERIPVLRQLGMAWAMIGDTPSAKRVFEMLAELEPENVAVKIMLFDLARKLSDEPEMNRQMELIEKAAGADSAEVPYCRASKIIWDYAQGKVGKEELAEAKTLLETVKETRPDWPKAPLGLAEVALMEGNYDATIQHLQRVDELGALTMQQLDLLVKLLRREGQYAEIKELLDRKEGMPMTEDTEKIRKEAEEEKVPARRISAEDTQQAVQAGSIAIREKGYSEAEILFHSAAEITPNGWLGIALEALNAQEAEREVLEKIAEMEALSPK